MLFRSSPNFGRGAWTSYSGSAQWLLRVTLDGLFGLHPTVDGLRLAPCLPRDWESCRVKRYFRDSLYEIEYRDLSGAKVRLTLDGDPVDGDTLPLPTRPVHHVVVRLE